MDEGGFGLGCGNMVRHPSGRPEADWIPCYGVAVAAVVAAEDLMIASKVGTMNRCCQLDSRDMVHHLVGSGAGSCIGRSKATATDTKSGWDS